MSETPVRHDLPTRCAELRVGEPKKLESPTDALDACTRTQSISDDSIRPTDNSKRIRIPQNICKKSNLPARSQEPHPRKPQRLRNDADASGTGMHTERNRIDAKTTVCVGIAE